MTTILNVCSEVRSGHRHHLRPPISLYQSSNEFPFTAVCLRPAVYVSEVVSWRTLLDVNVNDGADGTMYEVCSTNEEL